ncbi:hypothetical protein HNQ72_006182 [Rhizobium wenxiniae]|uniref:HEAT repeat domain-containing protein n=1 Tax=Rhizobium wenxiniae TaxID=1737357 RepID=A0A7X0D4B3_9HYPH|nr:hypothetical protein [Rhizobium wenxiniae]MBB6166331.1 hypothetical protein [Rhizobium wenxiniae]
MQTSEIVAELSKGGLTASEAYDFEQALFTRWREGKDLAPLVNLLASEITDQRMRGIYYLGELARFVPELNEAALLLADDPLAQGRRAFVIYVGRSNVNEQRTLVGLATCLIDLDLNVRASVLAWSVSTTDEAFINFSSLVQGGQGAIKSRKWREYDMARGARGLQIASRIRSGDALDLIRRETPGEDSYTFDYLKSYVRRLRTHREPSSSEP